MTKLLWAVSLAFCLMGAEPADFEGWMKQGAAALSTGQYSQAADSFRTAVKLKPRSVEARLGLANAYRFQNALESAQTEFQRVVELDSKNVTALQALGALSVQQGQMDAAAEWYQKLLVVDARNKDALYSLGVIAWMKVKPVRAAAKRELGMKPDDPGPIPDADVRNQLRSQLEPTIDDGIANCEKALQVDAKFDGAMEYLSLLLRERADLRDTEDEYNADLEAADQWAQKCAELRKAKQSQ